MPGPTPSAVLGLLHSQLTYHPPLPTSDFDGQTAIVTGANTGLGRDTVKHLVRLGARTVILAVRDVAKGEAARKSIAQETGRGECMQVWQLDLSNFNNIKAFATRVQDELPRLDVAVMNAGIWCTKFELIEGYESTIAINVLSTFLLTRLLLPKMQQTALTTKTVPRLTVLTSTLHKFASLESSTVPQSTIFSALNLPIPAKKFDNRYYDSKLLVQLYGQRLAEEEAGKGVCICFASPGWCSSSLRAVGGLPEKILARSVDEGARVVIQAISQEGVEGRHGAYWEDGKVKKPAKWIESEDGKRTCGRVWQELNDILNEVMEQPAI